MGTLTSHQARPHFYFKSIAGQLSFRQKYLRIISSFLANSKYVSVALVSDDVFFLVSSHIRAVHKTMITTKRAKLTANRCNFRFSCQKSHFPSTPYVFGHFKVFLNRVNVTVFFLVKA